MIKTVLNHNVIFSLSGKRFIFPHVLHILFLVLYELTYYRSHHPVFYGGNEYKHLQHWFRLRNRNPIYGLQFFPLIVQFLCFEVAEREISCPARVTV